MTGLTVMIHLKHELKIKKKKIKLKAFVREAGAKWGERREKGGGEG